MTFRLKRCPAGVDAEAVGVELERIHAEREGLRPAEVVEEARPKTAALHPAFEWNNGVAGEKWREHQARKLIRSIEVVEDRDGEEPLATKVYVHVQDAYHPVEQVIRSPDMFTAAVGELNAKMNAAARALADLETAAAGTLDSERMARIALAMRAMDAAASAVKAIH
jgi:hypothetical protein